LGYRIMAAAGTNSRRNLCRRILGARAHHAGNKPSVVFRIGDLARRPDGGGGRRLQERKKDESILGAIYDESLNTWGTRKPPSGWNKIGDAPGVVLPGGG